MKLTCFLLICLGLLCGGAGAYCDHLTYVDGHYERGEFKRALTYKPFARFGYITGIVFGLMGILNFPGCPQPPKEYEEEAAEEGGPQ